jgi:hypothetical protein
MEVATYGEDWEDRMAMNEPWHNQLQQAAFLQQEMFQRIAGGNGQQCDPRTKLANLVDAYARMQGRLDAYGALGITFPEDLEEEMASLASKARAAHREAQEAERQALREEIKALQTKEQKRKDAEAKLAALEEKLK